MKFLNLIEVSERTFQVFFVFLFLAIQSFFRESISIGFDAVHSKLKWNSTVMTKAQVGFFFLHVIMQIPAGMRAEKYGGKIVMQLAMFFCAFISLLTPLSMVAGSRVLFILFVSLQGLGEGCFIPVFYVFTSTWVPPHQRSRLFSAAFAGMHFGSLVGIPIIMLITDIWWFSGFVLSAVLGFLWVVMSIYFVQLWRPRKRLSLRSRKNLHLLFGKIRITETGARLKVPWGKILMSLPFWCTMTSHFGAVWANSIFLRDLSYFSSLHEAILGAEFLIQPFVVSLTAIVVFVVFIEIMKYYKIRKQTRRKVMNSICLWGSSSMLFILAINTEFYLSFEVTIFMIGAACTSASYTGVFLNHAELSPVFAGTLMGISNVVGNSASIVKPVLRQYMLDVEPFDQGKEYSADEWAWYFTVNAVILFYINLPFLLYGRSKEQLWYQLDEVAEQLNEYEMKSIAKEERTQSKTSHNEKYVDSVVLQRNSDRRKYLSGLRVSPTNNAPDSIIDVSTSQDLS